MPMLAPTIPMISTTRAITATKATEPWKASGNTFQT